MDRLTLERTQVGWYLAAIAAGLAVGTLLPGLDSAFELAIWPLLAFLLYATFCQVDVLHLRTAFTDVRFTSAVVIGNFVAIPLLLWATQGLLPDDPAIRLGFLLVLLVPCTDWFITFTQLGKGDTARAITITPTVLVVQMLLLPLYLWWLAPDGFSGSVGLADVWPALLIIAVPFVAAVASERWWWPSKSGPSVREGLGWLPVPLLAFVLLAIAGSQASSLSDAVDVVSVVVPYAVGFLIVALILAKVVTVLIRLPVEQGRTLAFSFGTRNSFVILPLALALPAGWEAAVYVIVVQTLVELLGMVVFLWCVPRYVFATRKGSAL